MGMGMQGEGTRRAGTLHSAALEAVGLDRGRPVHPPARTRSRAPSAAHPFQVQAQALLPVVVGRAWRDTARVTATPSPRCRPRRQAQAQAAGCRAAPHGGAGLQAPAGARSMGPTGTVMARGVTGRATATGRGRGIAPTSGCCHHPASPVPVPAAPTSSRPSPHRCCHPRPRRLPCHTLHPPRSFACHRFQAATDLRPLPVPVPMAATTAPVFRTPLPVPLHRWI